MVRGHRSGYRSRKSLADHFDASRYRWQSNTERCEQSRANQTTERAVISCRSLIEHLRWRCCALESPRSKAGSRGSSCSAFFTSSISFPTTEFPVFGQHALEFLSEVLTLKLQFANCRGGLFGWVARLRNHSDGGDRGDGEADRTVVGKNRRGLSGFVGGLHMYSNCQRVIFHICFDLDPALMSSVDSQRLNYIMTCLHHVSVYVLMS